MAASPRAACYGGGLLPLFFVGSPPLVDATRVSRRAATPPDVTTPGVPQNWRRAGSAAFALLVKPPRGGLKRRGGGPLQAYGRGHASRATPSRGLASRRLAEALASHKGRAAWALAVRRVRSGRRAARRPLRSWQLHLPPTIVRSRTSTVSYRDWEQSCLPSELRSRSGGRPASS